MRYNIFLSLRKSTSSGIAEEACEYLKWGMVALIINPRNKEAKAGRFEA